MHYDGNEDKVETDSTIFQYYTLFSFFSLVADDQDNEVGEKKNPTKKKKGKLFVIQHYKDGRALFPLTFEEELGRGKVIFIFHSSRYLSFGTLY